jgi:hypothetical protein
MLVAIGRAAARQVRVAGRLTAQLTAPRAALVVPSGIRVAAVFARAYRRAVAEGTAATKKPAAKKTATKKPAAQRAAESKTGTAKKSAGRPPRKVLTEEQKARREQRKLREEVKELKKKALLEEEPKKLPNRAWVVYTVHRFKDAPRGLDGQSFADYVRQMAKDFKAMTPVEREVSRRRALRVRTLIILTYR